MRCVTYGELASFHAFEPFPATGSQMLLYGSQMPDEKPSEEGHDISHHGTYI